MAVPADFAGAREFMADPNQAGTAKAMGDSLAIHLQLMHYLQPTLLANGCAPADFNRLATRARNALTAANAFDDRESATRQLRPMSRVPGDWGATNNLANVRLNQLTQFDGESKDTREVVRWLNRMVNASEAHTLTQAATINLLIHCSKGPASDLVDRLRNEGKTYLEIARALELRFGDLCPSEEAVVKVNTMPRAPGEPLPTFLDRLRHVAEMAKRHIADADERQTAIDQLIESNIRRALPTSVREALEERILTRSRMGQPPFSLSDLEKECVELERKRDERHAKKKPKSTFLRPRAIQAVQHMPNQVYYQPQVASITSTYADSSSDEDTPEEQEINDEVYTAPEFSDPAMIQLVHNANHISNKYQVRGVTVNPEQVFQKAIRRYNKYPQGGQNTGPSGGKGQQRAPQGAPGQWKQGRQDRPQARQVTAMAYPQPVGVPAYPQQMGIPAYQQPAIQPAQQHQGPPNRLPGNARINIRDLLALGNCTVGECVRCGRQGHIMSSEACPLRGKPLQDRACLKCKKGLHGVNDCLLTFQQPQQGHINMVQADISDDDSDDLN